MVNISEALRITRSKPQAPKTPEDQFVETAVSFLRGKGHLGKGLGGTSISADEIEEYIKKRARPIPPPDQTETFPPNSSSNLIKTAE